MCTPLGRRGAHVVQDGLRIEAKALRDWAQAVGSERVLGVDVCNLCVMARVVVMTGVEVSVTLKT